MCRDGCSAADICCPTHLPAWAVHWAAVSQDDRHAGELVKPVLLGWARRLWPYGAAALIRTQCRMWAGNQTRGTHTRPSLQLTFGVCPRGMMFSLHGRSSVASLCVWYARP
jgi:hypothetical protein